MEKSTLERIIYRQAEEEARQSLEALKEFLFNNPIASLLTIKIDGKDVPIVCNHSGGLISNSETFHAKTNIKEVFERVTEQFVLKRTQDLMVKLDNLKYLFQDQ